MRKRLYTITVDNSAAQSHNINIDRPTYGCLAVSMEEAVGKMMLSDFQYKRKEIVSINDWESKLYPL